MSAYGYRGRHRKPTNTSKRVAQAAIASAVAAGPSVTMVGTAQAAGTLDVIAQCESSGNPQASNGTHFGLFQFDLPTWRSVGGTGNPMNASAAEQYKRAEMLLAARGTQPWNASKSCWQGHTAARSATSPVQRPQAKPRVAPVPVSDSSRTVHRGGYVVKAGDTLTSIAAARDTTWREIAARNADAVRNPDLIFPGQHLAV
jgi:nucleoid-associated protein YgaU